MTYEPTTLIARRGYSDLGDASSCGTGQEWDAGCTFNGIKGQCVPAGTVGKAANCTYPSSGGIVSFFGGLLSGALNLYGQSKVAQGQAQAYQSMQPQQNQTPSWVMPVAIGGAAVVAVMLLKGKRKNPARRRRHRRSRRR